MTRNHERPSSWSDPVRRHRGSWRSCQAAITLLILYSLVVSCGTTPTGQGTNAPPIATSTSTSAPTIPDTPSPTASATPVPSGPCDNPLIPLRVGNEWKYQSTSPVGASLQILRVTGWNEEFGLNAEVEAENLETGDVTRDLVTCLEGGGIEDLPLFFISMQMGDFMDGMFNTYYEKGIYAPPYSDFLNSNWLLDWNAEYMTEESICFKNVIAGGGLCLNRSSGIELIFDTSGETEPVTVPAGTFAQALKVTMTYRSSATLSYPTVATSAPLTIKIQQWYAPFIGLVRAEVIEAYVELYTGQQTGVPVESIIELVEYSLTP